ncbi:unnamed protein product [Pedinophyceae sp. YPF-701]|nr:unnamed protein product [Pedinophyceae sp. YPF-701]
MSRGSAHQEWSSRGTRAPPGLAPPQHQPHSAVSPVEALMRPTSGSRSVGGDPVLQSTPEMAPAREHTTQQGPFASTAAGSINGQPQGAWGPAEAALRPLVRASTLGTPAREGERGQASVSTRAPSAAASDVPVVSRHRAFSPRPVSAKVSPQVAVPEGRTSLGDGTTQVHSPTLTVQRKKWASEATSLSRHGSGPPSGSVRGLVKCDGSISEDEFHGLLRSTEIGLRGGVDIKRLPFRAQEVARTLDVDHSGFLDGEEVGEAVLALVRLRKERRTLRRAVVALALFAVFLLLGVSGLVWTVQRMTRDMSVAGGALVDSDTGLPVLTSSAEFLSRPDGRLVNRETGQPVQVSASSYSGPLSSALPDRALGELISLVATSPSGANVNLKVQGVARFPDARTATGSYVEIMTAAGAVRLDGSDMTFQSDAVASVFERAGFTLYRSRRRLASHHDAPTGMYNTLDSSLYTLTRSGAQAGLNPGNGSDADQTFGGNVVRGSGADQAPPLALPAEFTAEATVYHPCVVGAVDKCGPDTPGVTRFRGERWVETSAYIVSVGGSTYTRRTYPAYPGQVEHEVHDHEAREAVSWQEVDGTGEALHCARRRAVHLSELSTYFTVDVTSLRTRRKKTTVEAVLRPTALLETTANIGGAYDAVAAGFRVEYVHHDRRGHLVEVTDALTGTLTVFHSMVFPIASGDRSGLESLMSAPACEAGDPQREALVPRMVDAYGGAEGTEQPVLSAARRSLVSPALRVARGLQQTGCFDYDVDWPVGSAMDVVVSSPCTSSSVSTTTLTLRGSYARSGTCEAFGAVAIAYDSISGEASVLPGSMGLTCTARETANAAGHAWLSAAMSTQDLVDVPLHLASYDTLPVAGGEVRVRNQVSLEGSNVVALDLEAIGGSVRVGARIVPTGACAHDVAAGQHIGGPGGAHHQPVAESAVRFFQWEWRSEAPASTWEFTASTEHHQTCTAQDALPVVA